MLGSTVSVDTKALRHNLRQFRKLAEPGVSIMSIVKSEAYGHGLIGTAQSIERATDWFGTVNLDEALRLRSAGIRKPLLVMSYFDRSLLPEAIRKRIALPVIDRHSLRAIAGAATTLKRRATVHLKVDTGTTRLGVAPDEALRLARQVRAHRWLVFEGVFSHLADAEGEDQSFTNTQRRTFNHTIDRLARSGMRPPLVHLACSAAALTDSETHYNCLRVGIALYGLMPSVPTKRRSRSVHRWLRLKPALSWKTSLVQVKTVEAGTTIGYGRTARVSRSTRIGLIPVGYFEGYDRKLSNRGMVLVRGRRTPVVGRVCMNVTMVNLNSVPRASVGDEVVLIGRQGRRTVTPEEIAEKTQTINYEVVSRINPQLPRVYV